MNKGTSEPGLQAVCQDRVVLEDPSSVVPPPGLIPPGDSPVSLHPPSSLPANGRGSSSTADFTLSYQKPAVTLCHFVA